MTPDSREARIEAEAVTDAEVEAACAAHWHAKCPDETRFPDGWPADTKDTDWADERRAWMRAALEASRRVAASNDSGEAELCYGGGLALPHRIFRDPRAAPQPAPDRVSRIERLERFASTLAAGVGHGVEAWNSALIAAAKAWSESNGV